MYEIARNSKKIRTYSSSRSSKVIDFGVNRKPMYDFLLVINSNFGRISWWWPVLVVSALVSINEVILRRARLVLGWVTVFGRVYHLGV